jgi:biotin carboxyl carrier protein
MKLQVKIQDKTYLVRLGDINARPIQAEVEGEIFEVWPQEILVPNGDSRSAPSVPLAHPIQPVEKTDSVGKPASQPLKVLAPIPGVVVEIKVSRGDLVEYGQELCVLEAMKMKNAIRSNREGIIDTIHVTEGAQVQQSQELFSFREDGQG